MDDAWEWLFGPTADDDGEDDPLQISHHPADFQPPRGTPPGRAA